MREPMPSWWPPAPEWAERISHSRNEETGVRSRLYSRDLLSSSGDRGELFELHVWVPHRGFDVVGPEVELSSLYLSVEGLSSLLDQAAQHSMSAAAA